MTLRAFLLCCLLVMLGSSAAQAERRVALVIGNSAYTSAAALRNPRNDAGDMAEALRKLGFEVVLGVDLNQERFAGTIETFARAIDGADVALFFYAGHGLQLNDRNYLVSIDAQLTNEFLIPSETIQLDAVVRLMESKVPVNVVLLDACRNNPLADNLKRSLEIMRRSSALGRGLARIEPYGRDTLVAFAAAPGQEAADGGGRNSPFTASLLRQMPKKGVEISVMLKEVAAEVRKSTNDAQRPQQISDMARQFYFAPSEALAKTEPAAPRPPPAAPSPPRSAQNEDRALEIAFWNSARAANECEAIRAYLNRYPNGFFVDLAKLSETRLCATDRKVTIVESVPQPAAPPAPPAAPAPPAVAAAKSEAPRPLPQPVEPPKAPAAQPAPSPPAAAKPPAGDQTALLKPPGLPLPGPPAPAQVFRDCERCPEMVTIPGGSFMMGSNDDASEKPLHPVTVGAFALGRYPVTIGEWRQCVADKACSYEPAGDDKLPVYNVSWTDAQQYIAWLSKLTKQDYRLPSESEWEYAARAKTTTRYWWGDQPPAGKAACKGCGTDANASQPIKVGSFAANPFGLNDMTGSVSQWVADCWVKNYEGAPRSGAAREVPNCRQYVLRGGSWKNEASYLRTASRDYYDKGVRYLAHGFRVARQKGN